MFSVRPVCRFTIIAVVLVSVTALNLILKDRLVMALSAAAVVWLWLYLKNLKIEITGCRLIKHSGNIFKHKTIILLKNIFYIQTFVFAPFLPAVVRIYSRSNRIFIIGLDGRQVTFLEKAVGKTFKY